MYASLKKYAWLITAVVLFSFNVPENHLKIFMAGDSTMAIKTPRTFPETGWGVPFANFFDSTVSVINLARNGRSTRTFISEKIWNELIRDVRPGDYVFIQFGHNDESKEKTERYSSPAEYKNNLERFLNETEQKGGVPVLLTPVGRRRFDSSGKILESHVVYSDVVRQIAKERKVYFIDADKISQALYQSFGREASRMLFLQLKKGEHPNYPDGRDDNTHFNELGARLVAQAILKEMRELQLPLIQRLAKPIKK